MADDNASPDEAESLIGRELDGKYRLSSILGRGSMGIVYKGEHLFMDRPIAVKILHAHLVADDEWLRRFRHEAKIASMLHHPNSVGIYDYGVCEDLPYLVMEYVDGEPLSETFVRSRKVAWEILSPILTQVCSVLQEAHRLGIIHRDIKPENIFIAKDLQGKPHVRVLDFGVAKLLESSGVATTVATQHGMFLGTPRYASPEQALAKTLDGRSDLYALGVIMYEALSGTSLFTGSNPMEVLLERVNNDPKPLTEIAPGTRREISDIVAQCLARDPALRFQSAADLGEALALVDKPERLKMKIDPRWAWGAGAALLLLVILFSCGREKQQKGPPPANVVTTTTLRAAPETPAPAETAPPIATATKAPAPTPAGPFGPDSATPEPHVTWGAQNWWTPGPSLAPSPSYTAGPAGQPTAVWNDFHGFGVTPAPVISAAPGYSGEPALFEKANSLYQQQRYQEAIPLLEQAVQRNSNRLESHLALSTSYARVGNTSGAYAEAAEAVRLYPQSAFAHYDLACALALQGRRDAALDSLARAISLNGNARRWALEEADLASIRGTRKFRELTEEPGRRRPYFNGSLGTMLNRFGRTMQGAFNRQ